ncbi:hypothetical protein KIN20_019163 [Parelaphostrongylus tenuis]|uniref:Uncharacterized protein n=1 Tax=Parelaphostrongylus tenuis TaxID=148309 RepID=A0AAD5QQ26_PARTN|nr:hypothetical protein KIN20_019163 [Parelaphostrongylus tenuis]
MVKSLGKAFDTNEPSSLLIVDDVSTWERLGMRSSSVVRLIYRLFDRSESDGLLLVTFSMATKSFFTFISKADFHR